MLRTFKYRLYPNQDQKQVLSQAFGSVRFVYNKSLEYKISQYQIDEEKYISCFDLNKRIPTLKSKHPFLKNAPSQSLQASCKNLDSAYSHFFRRVKLGQKPGFPKYKSKYGKQSLQLPQGVKIDYKNSKIFIPKIKNVLGIFHRKIPSDSKIKTCTISKNTTNQYYISVLFEDGCEAPSKTLGKTIGIDLGIKDLIVTSDGKYINSEKYLKKYLNKVRRFSRSLSLKKKGSNNREKFKFKLAKLHQKIRNCRIDNLHKISKEIINNNQVIFLEDLNIKSMLSGSNCNSNANLNRSIADASWRTLIDMLKYKSDLYGRYVFEVDPKNTSKMCSSCLTINNNLKLNIRKWQCKHCKTKHDRDINAARNVLRIGKGLPEYKNALNGDIIYDVA